MKALLITLGLFFLSISAWADDGFFKQLTLPAGQVITIGEGRGEPASIGSYDVRLYSGANPEFPLDQFIDGKLLVRNGSIKEVMVNDINSDKQAELIVIIESAGSGGYLDADAFTISNASGLNTFRHVEGLAPNSDIIKALKNASNLPR